MPTLTPSFAMKSKATLILLSAFSMLSEPSSQGRFNVGNPNGSAPG